MSASTAPPRSPGVVATQPWLSEPWRFHLRIPTQHRAYPGPPLEPGRYPQLLARYVSGETIIEIRAAQLEREVDAADWLAHSPLLVGISLVGEVTSHDNGASAEAKAEAHGGPKPWVARYRALKAGPRIFVLSVGAPREHARTLENIFEGFSPLHQADAKFAEPLRSYGGEAPVSWSVSLPVSWVIDPGTESETASSFQAENHQRYPGERDELVGKLAFAVLSRSLARTAREVAALYLDAVREHGLVVSAADVVAVRARRPFLGSWQLSAPVLRDDLAGEVRCRVVCDERIWALGGVLSLRREDHLDAWMQNKRALDLLFVSLRIAP